MVGRIFEQFAAGVSPRAIAKRLNAEGVRGAGGRDRRDTTIRGQVDRGILNNPVYVGRLERNRCSLVKDPRTGKTVARPNPCNQWQVVPRPDLQIVSDELWEAVKACRAEVRIVMTQDDENPAPGGGRRSTGSEYRVVIRSAVTARHDPPSSGARRRPDRAGRAVRPAARGYAAGSSEDGGRRTIDRSSGGRARRVEVRLEFRDVAPIRSRSIPRRARCAARRPRESSICATPAVAAPVARTVGARRPTSLWARSSPK